MFASSPADLPGLFRDAFAAKDPSAVAALYEQEGQIAADTATPVVGRSAIRHMAAQFIAQRPQCSLEATDAVQSGDLALVRSRWTIVLPDGTGGTSQLQIQPSLVAQRQAEGHWLVVIDCPRPMAL